MRFKLIYPRWDKLERQTEFHLPPHGPIVFAATVPKEVELDFVDENVQAIDFDDTPDFVGISVMLTCQVKRACQISDIYRKKGIKVIFGGIATMLHAKEMMQHGDSVFLGEAETRMGKGKGAPEGFVYPITPGRIIFEIEGVPFDVAKEALRLGSQKFPITTKFVVRRDYEEES